MFKKYFLILVTSNWKTLWGWETPLQHVIFVPHQEECIPSALLRGALILGPVEVESLLTSPELQRGVQRLYEEEVWAEAEGFFSVFILHFSSFSPHTAHAVSPFLPTEVRLGIFILLNMFQGIVESQTFFDWKRP